MSSPPFTDRSAFGSCLTVPRLPFATSVLWVFTSCLTLATLTPFPSHLVTRAPPGPEGVRDEEEKRMSVVKERLTITGGKGVSVERVE